MKKIILSVFFAAALLSNVIFIPSVSAAETEFFNCSKETQLGPETAENTCFRLYPSLPTVKRLAPDSKCNNTGWTNGNVCCCESKIDYNCSWREIKTTTTCAGPGQCVTSSSGGCLSGESKGGDCNAGVRPKDGATKTYDCCCPAAAYTTQKAKFTMPDWQVPIDTITLSEAKCTGPDNSGECEIPWIAEYIQGMYKYGLGIGGILAAIILMAGGVLWLVSAGDVSKITQAKDLIIGSITGLMILMGSYILLSQINPELINLRSISVRMIERIVIEADTEGTTPVALDMEGTTGILNVNCGTDTVADIIKKSKGKVTYNNPNRGKTGPNNTVYNDCSGFANFVLKCAFGISSGSYTADIFAGQSSWAGDINTLKPGDLVGWAPKNSSKGFGHVFIYMGNGLFGDCHGGDSGRQPGNCVSTDLSLKSVQSSAGRHSGGKLFFKRY